MNAARLCAFEWGEGKLFQLAQRFRLPDSTPVAKIDGVVGLLDLATRRLIPDPRGRLRALAMSPSAPALSFLPPKSRS